MINSKNTLITETMPKIGVDAYAVLMVIASHLRVGPVTWPGIKRIRKLAMVRSLDGKMKPMSERRVYAAINTLIEFKLISREQERLENGDWGRRYFRLTTDAISVYWNVSNEVLIEEKEDQNGGDGLVQSDEARNGLVGNGEAINGEAITAETEYIDKRELYINQDQEISEKWLSKGSDRFQVAFKKVIIYLRDDPKRWEHILNHARIKLAKEQFLDEITDWLVHHQDNVMVMQNPIKKLMGGQHSFYSWLRNEITRKKYEKKEPTRQKSNYQSSGEVTPTYRRKK